MIGAAVGALILGGLGVFTVPVQAAATDASKVCPTWQLRGATGKYPEIVWGEPGEGSGVTATTVTLVKPAAGVDPGVEFVAKAANLPAGTITVDYALSGGADFSAGAVRLYYYAAAGADTVNDAPTGVAPATASSGTLTVTAAGPVGTIGFVYDASNPSTGKVTFSDLKVGGTAVAFTDVCTSPSPSASPSPSPSVSPSVSASASASPSTSATETAAPGGVAGGDEPSLPLTGVSVPMLAGAAAVLIGLGVGLFLLTRKRRITTVA
jgi:hypothetical protein